MKVFGIHTFTAVFFFPSLMISRGFDADFGKGFVDELGHVPNTSLCCVMYYFSITSMRYESYNWWNTSILIYKGATIFNVLFFFFLEIVYTFVLPKNNPI